MLKILLVFGDCLLHKGHMLIDFVVNHLFMQSEQNLCEHDNSNTIILYFFKQIGQISSPLNFSTNNIDL